MGKSEILQQWIDEDMKIAIRYSKIVKEFVLKAIDEKNKNDETPED